MISSRALKNLNITGKCSSKNERRLIEGDDTRQKLCFFVCMNGYCRM